MANELICPECKDVEFRLFEERESNLGLGIIYTYGCEHCGGTFEVKRGKE